ISGDSVAKSLKGILLLSVGSQQNDSCLRTCLENLSRSINPIQQWHGDVEDHDVRSQFLSQLYGLDSVGGLARDLKPFRLEDRLKSLADHRVIVSECYADRHVLYFYGTERVRGSIFSRNCRRILRPGARHAKAIIRQCLHLL